MSYLAATLVALSSLAAGAPEHLAARYAYLYHLADSNGRLSMSWAPLARDQRASELFVVDTSKRAVRVFGGKGMQSFRFGDDRALGVATSIAPLDNGDLIVLTAEAGKRSIVRCNFRGKVLRRLNLRGVPRAIADEFTPDAVVSRYDVLYFLDSSAMRVVVTDAKGKHQRSHDLAALLKLDRQKRDDTGVAGFNVDYAGNVLFTVQPLFAAFIVAPDETLRGFGSKGSRPGRFNVVGGIAADEAGFLYVTDVLRGVVQVFDPDRRFRGEFGGEIPGFRTPRHIVAGNGKVFVSLGAGQGVATFRVSVPPYSAPKPSAPASKATTPNNPTTTNSHLGQTGSVDQVSTKELPKLNPTLTSGGFLELSSLTSGS